MANEVEDSALQISPADGTKWRFKTWRELSIWSSEFRSAWNWISDDVGPDHSNASGNIASKFNQIDEAIRSAKAEGQKPAALQDLLNNLLGDSYAPAHPESELGRIVLDIHHALGGVAALFAFALLKGQVSFQQAATLHQARGAVLALHPALLTSVWDADTLARERRNFRDRLRQVSEEMKERDLERERLWTQMVDQSADVSRDWARRRAATWIRYVRMWRRAKRASIRDIRAVETAYRETMALQAPVDYWRKKAAEHEGKETIARRNLSLFFPWAIVGLLVTFGGATGILILVGGRATPPGLTFVLSAGLASVAALAFWVGRLLTKLYLSEHHLRQDAEERAVMTQTYLALTADSAASDADRQIILTALFRGTSDGIVKDDGNFDPSMAALVAKAMTR